MAPGLFGRSSGGLSCRAYSSESKERDRGQSKEESQKAETCKRGEEEKMSRIPPTTLGQGTSKGHHSFEEHRRFSDCRN